jgi:hypothetical protein
LVILQAFTSAAAPERARAAVAEYGRQTFSHIVALIAEGQTEGSVGAGNPADLATAFTACIQGVALGRLQGSSGDVGFPRAETILRLFRAP